MQPVTAMTELIEYLQNEKDTSILPLVKLATERFIRKATELLSKERSQIVDAFEAGYDNDFGYIAEQYFTESFKQ